MQIIYFFLQPVPDWGCVVSECSTSQSQVSDIKRAQYFEMLLNACFRSIDLSQELKEKFIDKVAEWKYTQDKKLV